MPPAIEARPTKGENSVYKRGPRGLPCVPLSVEIMEPFLQRAVMPATQEDDPELWEAMSPIAHVHAGAPPFFVIQGSLDVLVWREETQRLEVVARDSRRLRLRRS